MPLKYVLLLLFLVTRSSVVSSNNNFHHAISDNPVTIEDFVKLLAIKYSPWPNSIDSDAFADLSSSIQNEDESDNSEICSQKLVNLTEALIFKNNSRLLDESVSFFDALGKPPSGLLRGNFLLLGSYDSCLQIKTTSNGYYKPCKISATVRIKNNEATKQSITWTTCFPEECRNGNFTSLKANVLKAINRYPKVLYIADKDVYTSCDAALPYDFGAYVAIILISVIIFLVIVGSLWDPVGSLIQSFGSQEDTSVLINAECSDVAQSVVYTATDTADEIVRDAGNTKIQRVTSTEHESTSVLGRIIRCFSLQRNFSALLTTNTKPGQVLCLNGIRVISINWVVLGHIYYIGRTYPDLTPYNQIFSRLSFSVIYNALPAVDTFFFISGFLVALLLLKDLHRRNGSFNAIGYYLHRYLRLTIPYLMVILIQGFLYRIWISGPFSDIFSVNHESCKKWWWTNVLYINNLVPWNKLEICIGQSWYLSNDFQFFLIAPVFILLLFRKRAIGVLLICLSLVGSAIIAGVLTAAYDFGPTVVFDKNETNMTHFRMIYDKPWTRIPPYLIGIWGGWVYWAYFDKIKIVVTVMQPIKKLLYGGSLWAITCGIQYAIVFGLHHDMLNTLDHGKFPNKAESVAYEMCARSSWAMTLLVQIFACQAGLGGVINKVLSWSGWLVFSRLTFAVYLLHYGIIQSLVAQLRHPFYFASDYEVVIIYLGCLVMSYAGSVLLYTFVEQPLAHLERLIPYRG